MMQFNVARLLKESVGTSHRHTLDATFAPLEDTQTDRVWGQLQLMRVNEGVWVSGALDANAVCTCSRCLQDFPLSLRFQLDEIYVSVLDITTGASLPLPEDADASFTIDDHHVLDITEAVRQSIILALPMKPLCGPNCAGICPECGTNRNEARCACKARRIDPQWSSWLPKGRTLGVDYGPSTQEETDQNEERNALEPFPAQRGFAFHLSRVPYPQALP